MKLLPKKILGAAALPALALLLALSGVSAPVSAQGPSDNMRTISVSATGTANGSPDVAYAELGVEVRNPSVGDAVSQANSSMQDVIDALTGMGIAQEDIQTTQFNVYQESPPTPVDPNATTTQQQAPANYVVDNIVRVTVRDLNQVSDVIQGSLDAGANQVYGLSFGLSDSDALRSQARQDAASGARAQAEELASAFGVTLGAPVSISENDSGGPGLVMEAATFARGGGGPPVSTGQLTVTVQLNVTYELIPAP